MNHKYHYIVYIHINKTNGKVYVGITSTSVKQRWNGGKGYKSNKHFYRAIEKYGWDGFLHIVYRTDLFEKEAKDIEKELIALYKSDDSLYGYNKTKGGESGYLGKDSMSKEYRNEQSRAHYARNPKKHNARTRLYYKTHKEEIKSHNHEYYEKHKEDMLKKTRIYHENHKEEIRKRQHVHGKEYRETNKEKLNRQYKEYYETHREERIAYAKSRYELKKSIKNKTI